MRTSRHSTGHPRAAAHATLLLAVALLTASCTCGSCSQDATPGPDADAATPADAAPAAPPPPRFTPTTRTKEPAEDLVLEREDILAPVQDGLRRQDGLADLDRLHRLITRGYAGYDTIDVTPARWDRAFINLQRWLRGQNAVRNADFLDRIEAELRPIITDPNLALWFERTEGGRESHRVTIGDPPALTTLLLDLDPDSNSPKLLPGAAPTPDLEGALVESCEGLPLSDRVTVWSAARGARVSRVRATGFVGARGDDTRVQCRLRLTNSTRRAMEVLIQPLAAPSAPSPATPGPPRFDRDGDGPPVVRVSDWARPPEAFAQVARDAHKEEVVLIDLRGSGDGPTAAAEAFVAEWATEELVGSHLKTLTSEVTAQGLFNAARAPIVLYEHARPDLADRDPEHIQRLSLGLGAARKALRDSMNKGPHRAWDSARRVVAPKATEPWTGRAAVLIDGSCLRPCEAFVQLARQLGAASVLVLGDRSGGASPLDQPGLYRLAFSGIQVQVPTRAAVDPDGVLTDRHGVEPDVWLDGGDPLDVARRLLSQTP